MYLNSKKLKNLLIDKEYGKDARKYFYFFLCLSVMEFLGIFFPYSAFLGLWPSILLTIISISILRYFNYDSFYVCWNYKFRNNPKFLEIWKNK